MKIKIFFALIALCSLTGFGQKPVEKFQPETQQIIIKKQILADQLDNQAKDVSFAAVRVFVRTKLAAWLWKDGRDDTGRAEQLAVRALEEFYDKKSEIGDANFLKTDLFALLEINAPNVAKKLRAKYAVGDEEDLSSAASLLDKEGGDKIVAAKIKKYLADGKDLTAISSLMGILANRKSPEFAAILAEIISLEESGRNNFPAEKFAWTVNEFKNALVPNDLRVRFYKIVLNKGRTALQTSDINNITSADHLLNVILPDIAANAPELLPEADGLKIVSATRISQKKRESQEANKRIEESADKLGAMISEAERTTDKAEKFNLLTRAQLLAVKENKFLLAVDLNEKMIEDKSEGDFPSTEFRLRFHDQRLTTISIQALDKDEVEAARYAAKKVINELLRADNLRRLALYFNKKKDTNEALSAYDEALKLTIKADNDKTKFFNLLYLISAAQQIDPNRTSEAATITAKAIDALPTLNSDDKPETENYKKYVASIMSINYNLYRVIPDLAKENKNEAANLASRINRKEVRIIADLALAFEAIDAEVRQSKTK
jgi:hypothetical protein